MLQVLFSLASLGIKRANPKACPTNNIKLAACPPCGELSSCEDTLVLSGGKPEDLLLTLTFDGEVFTPPSNLQIQDAQGIEDWICETVLPTKEFDLHAEVVWDETLQVLTIEHIGQCVISEITTSGSGTLEVTRNCVLLVICVYTCNSVDTFPEFSYNGNTGTLANNPYPYADDPTTDAATALQLQADLTTLLDSLGYPYVELEALVDTDDESFEMRIKAPQGNSLMIGSTLFNPTECMETFLDEDPANKSKNSTKKK